MKRILSAAAVTVAMSVALAGAANAEPGTGEQVQTNHDLFILGLGGDGDVGQDDTLGEAISAGWMGNTSNPRPDGPGVTPSLAPGIFVCTYDAIDGLPDCEPVVKGDPFGASVSAASKGQGQP